MKNITSIAETTHYLKRKREQGLKIGFVPTMGALHEGHLNLVRRSKNENDLTVCSIFVNPTQFNNPDDLAKYPRNIEQDLKVLKENLCDVVFTPHASEMYPQGENYNLNVDFGGLDGVMEGKFRPGHFNGVATVVKKLFDIVHPARAYFGKKDYQQLAIIMQLVKKMELSIEIVPCETIREPDGLAMSSRNARLTVGERSQASGIYKVLAKVKENAGRQPILEMKEWAVNQIEAIQGFRVEYFDIADKDNLLSIENWNFRNRAVAFVAVLVGEVRLIDNIELFS